MLRLKFENPHHLLFDMTSWLAPYPFVTLWLAPASAGRRTRERMPRLSSYKAPGINVGLAFFFGPARNTCCRESRRMEMSPPSGRTRWTWHSRCENHFNLVTVEKYSDQMVEICNQHKGKPSWKRKTFSFGHCPNYLSPPLPPIRASCTTFFGRKKRCLGISDSEKRLFVEQGGRSCASVQAALDKKFGLGRKF